MSKTIRVAALTVSALLAAACESGEATTVSAAAPSTTEQPTTEQPTTLQPTTSVPSTTVQPSTTRPPTATIDRRGVWPPAVPQCSAAPLHFRIPERWSAAIPVQHDNVCTWTALTQSPSQFDRPVDGLPGFFYAGSPELDGYPIYLIPVHTRDVSSSVESLIRSYLGEERQVELTTSGVVIDSPSDGLELRRVVNQAGVVGVRVRMVVRVASGYGGSPLVGATTTDIVFALPDGQVEMLSHGALQYEKKIPVDEVVATMDSIFASLSF